jgi:predicted amidohydrolase
MRSSLTPSPEVPEGIQVAVVQMRWNVADYYTPQSFAAKIDRYLQTIQSKAHPYLPTLVVFPEFVGMPCVFQGAEQLLQGATKFADAIAALARRDMPRALLNRIRFGVNQAQAVGLANAKAAGQTYVETFSSAARRYGYYIIAGSAVLPDFGFDGKGRLVYQVRDGRLHNVSYFFGPDGNIIGTQKKINLTELESKAGLGLTPGRLDDLRVFDTHFGKVGIALGLDAFREPVVQKLLSLGADVLVQPSASQGVWDEPRQAEWMRGSHHLVQTHPQLRLALNPMMTGPLLDLSFEGQSAICALSQAAAPLGYSKLAKVTGFLLVADDHLTDQALLTVRPAPPR